jgi:hypothetical protein
VKRDATLTTSGLVRALDAWTTAQETGADLRELGEVHVALSLARSEAEDPEVSRRTVHFEHGKPAPEQERDGRRRPKGATRSSEKFRTTLSPGRLDDLVLNVIRQRRSTLATLRAHFGAGIRVTESLSRLIAGAKLRRITKSISGRRIIEYTVATSGEPVDKVASRRVVSFAGGNANADDNEGQRRVHRKA